MKLLPTLPCLLFVSSTAAQGADPHSVFTLRGECQILVAGAEDLTGTCAGEVTQVVYTDSRMDLSIWTDDPNGRFLVLSGMASEQVGNLVLAIDHVTLGRDGSGNDNVDMKATGQCELTGSPMAGPAQYTCDATDEAGNPYQFAFLTDGSTPENMLD